MASASFDLKDYIPVSERVEKFYADFPDGRINTQIVDHSPDTGFVLFKANIYRDDAEPSATGHAFEVRGDGYVNKTSHIENCETSAVGRALALLGYEIKKGIASREEMGKVQRMQTPAAAKQQPAAAVRPPAAEELFAQAKLECGALFCELNQLNDSIKWSGDTIDGYVQTIFEVNSIDDLSLPTLAELKADLETRKKTLQKKGGLAKAV
jgi:hypothetical protein